MQIANWTGTHWCCCVINLVWGVLHMLEARKSPHSFLNCNWKFVYLSSWELELANKTSWTVLGHLEGTVIFLCQLCSPELCHELSTRRAEQLLSAVQCLILAGFGLWRQSPNRAVSRAGKLLAGLCTADFGWQCSCLLGWAGLTHWQKWGKQVWEE